MKVVEGSKIEARFDKKYRYFFDNKLFTGIRIADVIFGRQIYEYIVNGDYLFNNSNYNFRFLSLNKERFLSLEQFQKYINLMVFK